MLLRAAHEAQLAAGTRQQDRIGTVNKKDPLIHVWGLYRASHGKYGQPTMLSHPEVIQLDGTGRTLLAVRWIGHISGAIPEWTTSEIDRALIQNQKLPAYCRSISSEELFWDEPTRQRYSPEGILVAIEMKAENISRREFRLIRLEDIIFLREAPQDTWELQHTVQDTTAQVMAGTPSQSPPQQG